MGMGNLIATLVSALVVIGVMAVIITIAYMAFRKEVRGRKNYERALKMVQVMIQLPPSSEDKEVGSRDIRDVTDESISQAQTMYDIIASTATKGFHSRIYGQRHISFEIIAHDGLVHYYVAVPFLLLDNIKQAVIAAYPTARLEEVAEINVFNRASKMSGTLGGEMHLSRPYLFPIATYKDTKRDAMGAILNALTMAGRGDGVAVQILLRPAKPNWAHKIDDRVQDIRDGKKSASGNRKGSAALAYAGQILEALWKPPDEINKEKETKPLSGTDQTRVEQMEEKARHAGYEVMIRLVVSTPNSARSQALLTSLQSAFALYTLPTGNGFKFEPTGDIKSFVTDYIMRFFPAEKSSDILNSVELATIFHLPNQTNIPSSQVERQTFREIDGPTQAMNDGILLGNNVFRGVVKPIRLSLDDRRRHTYIMGSTGMGKSVLLKRLALQDMINGDGFAFIDPHGDAAEDILRMVPRERVNDVIYFNPTDSDNPIGMNLFEVSKDDPDPARTKDYIISETMNMLYSLYDPNHQGFVGPRMANIVRYAALLLMDSPGGGTFMDIPKVLRDPDFTKPRIKYLRTQQAIDFWTKEWPNAQRSNDAGEVTSWVVSKWADFENVVISNVLGQLHSGLNLREIMDKRKILLVNLSKGKLGDIPAKLLGMVFVMKFQAAAMSRANIPEEERKDFCLYVDEFQNFATDSFESILSEARKYRLNLIVANQFMGQLTDKIRGAIVGNVGTYIIGRVGSDDVENVVKMFQPTFQPEDLLYMPNYTAAVKMLVNGAPTAPFTMSLPPLKVQTNDDLAKSLIRLSAERYGRPRAEVEAEIEKRLSTTANAPARKPANSVVTVDKGTAVSQPSSNDFLQNWLAKRQASGQPVAQQPISPQPVSQPQPRAAQPGVRPASSTLSTPMSMIGQSQPTMPSAQPTQPTPPAQPTSVSPAPSAPLPPPAPATPPTPPNTEHYYNRVNAPAQTPVTNPPTAPAAPPTPPPTQPASRPDDDSEALTLHFH